jgi:hypothetical protein
MTKVRIYRFTNKWLSKELPHFVLRLANSLRFPLLYLSSKAFLASNGTLIVNVEFRRQWRKRNFLALQGHFTDMAKEDHKSHDS